MLISHLVAMPTIFENIRWHHRNPEKRCTTHLRPRAHRSCLGLAWRRPALIVPRDRVCEWQCVEGGELQCIDRVCEWQCVDGRVCEWQCVDRVCEWQ